MKFFAVIHIFYNFQQCVAMYVHVQLSVNFSMQLSWSLTDNDNFTAICICT